MAIFREHAHGKPPEAYLFTNRRGEQLSVGVVRKFPLGFRLHALRHNAASTWLRLGTPVNESPNTSATIRAQCSRYTPTYWETTNGPHLRRLTGAEEHPFEQRRADAPPTIAFQGSAADTPRAATARGVITSVRHC